jgi:phage shock protein E
MLRAFFFIFVSGLLMSTQAFGKEFWIDVRTTEEFNAGHLQASVHIPYEEIAARISEVTQDKNDVIHLYCRSGNRSGIAMGTLQSIGFKNAVNEGGYEDLLRKGLK